MGAFAAKVKALKTAGWEDTLKSQQARLHSVIPSTVDETTAKALETLKKFHAQAFAMGHDLRQSRQSQHGIEDLLQDDTNGVPGREVVVGLPALNGPKVAAAAEPAGDAQHEMLAHQTARAHHVASFNINAAVQKSAEKAVPVGQDGIHVLDKAGNVVQQYQVPFPYNGQLRILPLGKTKVACLVIDLPTERMRWYEPCLRSKEAGMLGAVTTPIKNFAQEAGVGIMNDAEEAKAKLTQPTTDPGSLPWYYPALAMGGVNHFQKGYQAADQELHTHQHAMMDKKLESAQRAFEHALKTEYAMAQAHKVASAGEAIDGLAQLHVKSAEGELNHAAGIYLALAGLLGQGAHAVGKKYVESHDSRYQMLAAQREAIKNRMRQSPPSIQVVSDAITPQELQPSVKYEPPQLSDLNPETSAA